MKLSACLYCGGVALTEITKRADNKSVLRCGSCQLMMVSELASEPTELYGKPYFEKSADSGVGYVDYLSAPAANVIGKYAFARLISGQAKGRYLDLGCADGSLVELFNRDGFDSEGFDISKQAIDIAVGKGLKARQSDLKKLPTGVSNSMLITAYDFLEHIATPRQTTESIASSLADGGYFVFSTLAVTRLDRDEYWFNHSLEHYLYFDRTSLTKILSDAFGPQNVVFIEILNNGVAEFWGVAKKGSPIVGEYDLLQMLAKGRYLPDEPEQAYLASLFYDQTSNFTAARRAIKTVAASMQQDMRTRASFFNYYFEGGLENALEVVKEAREQISATDGIFWQAVSDAERRFADIQRQQFDAEVGQQRQAFESKIAANEKLITDLRTQIFKVGEELSALRNSRLIRKAIHAREQAGKVRHSSAVRHIAKLRHIKKIPAASFHRVRVVVAPFVPAKIRKSTKRKVISARNTLREMRMHVVVVVNKTWPAKEPLVSVVIPYYNRKDTVDDTLMSLDAQTFRNFETIIIDDGSTDPESVEKLEQLMKTGLNARIVHQKNQGVAAARNNGIALSKGKYIVCLDSDDMLDPTFIEKSVIVLETQPDISLVTSYMDVFGVKSESTKHGAYDPLYLYSNNMVITAAAFRKKAWEVSGGYRSGIGYEDWEYWINLAEHGFWGKSIQEPLFKYRTAMSSRFLDDKIEHWENIELIRSFHPKFKKNIKKLLAQRKYIQHVIKPDTAFINMQQDAMYQAQEIHNERVLIAVPWMTFGGAETLIYNFCSELKERFDITFVTGLKSDNEWEYKFKEITPNVYHLANLFEQTELYIEFISNYIRTRDIKILHVIHNGFMFDMLPELKRRHPELKVVVTMFNDRVPEYFERSVDFEQYIDRFTTDNTIVSSHYDQLLGSTGRVTVIPNGINCYDVFNPQLFDREQERKLLGLEDGELAVYFVGRLSEEKNPDVFVEAARRLLTAKRSHKLKFFVIGDGPMRGVIEKSIGGIKNGNIQYLGYKPTAEVARYLAGADIFVLPSAIEGFPLSLLEAMAMRVIPVASHVGAVPEVVDSGRNGYVISPPGSVDAIVDVLVHLDDDRNEVASIKELARNDVETKYSNKVLGKAYTNMYRRVL